MRLLLREPAAAVAPSAQVAPILATAHGGLRLPPGSLLDTAPETPLPRSSAPEQVLEGILLDFLSSGSRMILLPRGHAGAATGLGHH